MNNVYERLWNRAAILDRRLSAKLSKNTPVATFTFDDFPCSAYEIGSRILEAADVRGTYFVSGGFLGRTIDGIRLYEEGHVKAAHEGGHEIGCHAFDHKKLGCFGSKFAEETCDRNAEFVRKLLGPNAIMTSFAYPYGDVSIPVKSKLARRFTLCRGVRQQLNSDTVDLAQISIVSLEMRHSNQLNFTNIIADAVKNKSWIVFLTHDISENPSPYGSTPAMIENALEALSAASIPVLPLKAAAEQVVLGMRAEGMKGDAIDNNLRFARAGCS